jgi:hypothetical protein
MFSNNVLKLDEKLTAVVKAADREFERLGFFLRRSKRAAAVAPAASFSLPCFSF